MMDPIHVKQQSRVAIENSEIRLKAGRIMRQNYGHFCFDVAAVTVKN